MLGREMTWDERCDAARRTPIMDLIARLDLGTPKKSGRQFQLLCPFHGERSPSFFVSPDKGLWHCFGCASGGDAIGLWMRATGLGFADTVRALVP